MLQVRETDRANTSSVTAARNGETCRKTIQAKQWSSSNMTMRCHSSGGRCSGGMVAAAGRRNESDDVVSGPTPVAACDSGKGTDMEKVDIGERRCVLLWVAMVIPAHVMGCGEGAGGPVKHRQSEARARITSRAWKGRARDLTSWFGRPSMVSKPEHIFAHRKACSRLRLYFCALPSQETPEQSGPCAFTLVALNGAPARRVKSRSVQQ